MTFSAAQQSHSVPYVAKPPSHVLNASSLIGSLVDLLFLLDQYFTHDSGVLAWSLLSLSSLVGTERSGGPFGPVSFVQFLITIGPPLRRADGGLPPG